MSEIITTLHKKGDLSVDLYPNIKRDNIPDGAVNSAKIEDGAVSQAKIGDGVITNNKLGLLSISTDKIQDSAITTAKIDDGAVTDNKIANNTISANKLDFHLYRYFGHFHDANIDYYFDITSTEDIDNATIYDIFYLISTYYVGAESPITYFESTSFVTGMIIAIDDETFGFTNNIGTASSVSVSNCTLDICYRVTLI